MMKAFISGPITNNPRYKKDFAYAKEKLNEDGYIVLNPADLPSGMSNLDYMRITIPMMLEADIVFFLPGWSKSDGAEIERSLALYCGLEVRRESHSYERFELSERHGFDGD